MKKLFFLLCIFTATFCFSQNQISFGMLHNYGVLLPNHKKYDYKPNFDVSFIGTSSSFRFNSEDKSFIDLQFQFSTLSDVYRQTNQDGSLYLIDKWKASSYSLGLNLGKKLSNYFSISSGLKFDLYSSQMFTIRNTSFIYEELFSASLTVPINVEFYLPIKKSNLILSNSLIMRNSNLYLQSMLSFQF